MSNGYHQCSTSMILFTNINTIFIMATTTRIITKSVMFIEKYCSFAYWPHTRKYLKNIYVIK